MAKQTGYKWSVTFGTSELTFMFKSLTPPQQTRPEVDMTSLADDNAAMEPGDVVDNGSLVFNAFFDDTIDPSDAIGGDEEAVTIYFGDSATSGTVTWEFDGWISNYAPQEGQSNQPAMCQITVRVNGAIKKGAVD